MIALSPANHNDYLRTDDKGNWEEMKKAMVDLRAQMEGLQENAITEEVWSLFKTTLQEITTRNIPHKTSRPKAHKLG